MSRKKRKKKHRPKPANKSSRKRKIRSSVPPSGIDSELQKAVRYHRSGQLEKAKGICEQILRINPNHAQCLHLLALIAHNAKNGDTALDLMHRAIRNDPDNPFFHNNLGNMLCDTGRPREAIDSYREALRLNPDYAEAYYNMGLAFRSQRKFEAAVQSYKNALQSKAEDAEVYNEMGNAFMDLGELDQAISSYKQAVQLKPDYAPAYNNMGIALKDQGKSDEAVASYQKALEINVNNAETYNNIVSQLHHMCRWSELKDLGGKLDDLTKESIDKGQRPAQTPFIGIIRHADPAYNMAISRLWSSHIAESVSKLRIQFPFVDRRSKKKKIVIGYLSNDFLDHPTTHLMLSLFRLHNRDCFDIFCYSYGPDDGSNYRKRILRDCDRFVDIHTVAHADAAEWIYEDGVDILVDLKGYTEGNRLEICALRPAPVQVAYLGFPGTTGADFFDYIITDRIVTPEDHIPYYTEHFVYLPHCYQVNDSMQQISDHKLEKQDFGLPKNAFVFCSFNQGYKIDSVMFSTWMNILKEVPNSVLWLQGGDENAGRNLKREAETRGVKSKRLVFAERLPKDEHLARLALADLALDTRIYNGHTTTSDSLYAGVPVIALEGTHFASRVSASILTAIGLPEMIVCNLDDYQALAVGLAHNPEKLKALRQKLAENRLTEPLFDTPRFARNLEKAYKEMWEIFVARQNPRQIEVVESQVDRSSFQN